MRIYIAGKYSGLPHEAAVEKFERTENQLIEAGIAPENIVNPMKLGIPKDEDWHCAIEICKAHLSRCTALFVQYDWRDSFGAKQEITLAQRLRLDVYFEETHDLREIENLIQAGV